MPDRIPPDNDAALRLVELLARLSVTRALNVEYEKTDSHPEEWQDHDGMPNTLVPRHGIAPGKRL